MAVPSDLTMTQNIATLLIIYRIIGPIGITPVLVSIFLVVVFGVLHIFNNVFTQIAMEHRNQELEREGQEQRRLKRFQQAEKERRAVASQNEQLSREKEGLQLVVGAQNDIIENLRAEVIVRSGVIGRIRSDCHLAKLKLAMMEEEKAKTVTEKAELEADYQMKSDALDKLHEEAHALKTDVRVLHAEHKKQKLRIRDLEFNIKCMEDEAPLLKAKSWRVRILYADELPKNMAEVDPRRLDPLARDFTCVGLERGESDQRCTIGIPFIPHTCRKTAADILNSMRSQDAEDTFTFIQLRALTRLMLCTKHQSVGNDQSKRIAKGWYKTLAEKRDAQATEQPQTPRAGSPTCCLDSDCSLSSTASTPWTMSSRSDASTAATTPDCDEDNQNPSDNDASPTRFARRARLRKDENC